MSDVRGIPGPRISSCIGRQPFLPPKSPGPIVPPSYVEYNSVQCRGPVGCPRPREGYRHQRTSSESVLIDEHPSWLDDLLNEPEALVNGAHRRSSSDSFAYVDMSNLSSNCDNLAYESFNHPRIAPKPFWGHEDFHHRNGLQHPQYMEENSFRRHLNRRKELTLNIVNYASSNHLSLNKMNITLPGPMSSTMEPEELTSPEQDYEESTQGVKEYLGKKDEPPSRQTQSEMETKQVKQQFAQPSRVRKLQYIAELERNVQVLQAERVEISAEIEFLSQQNLTLSLENTALKQRFDSISQEHLIKCFEQEMLERELAHLRGFLHNHQQLLQQQHHPQQQSQHQRKQQNPNPKHGRRSSRDVELKFSNLSLSHKDASSGQDPVSGPLHS